MRKFSLILVLIFTGIHLHAQDGEFPREDPQKGAINVNFVAGLNNSTPIGIDAKLARSVIHQMEDENEGYGGGLYPKTSAYGGFTIDYQFHEVGAFGFGVIYNTNGYWLFENNVPPTFEQPKGLDSRKTFLSVDYIDFPLFYKEYLKNEKISLRFGPVVSLMVISKLRIKSSVNGEVEQQVSRLGEKQGVIHYSGLINERPKDLVPGIDAQFNFGNSGGWHGGIGFTYSASMFRNADIRFFVARAGVGYTFSK